MPHSKSQLLTLARKVEDKQPITPQELSLLQNFHKEDKAKSAIETLQNLAVPLSLVLGFSLAVFSEIFDSFVEYFPVWTNLSPPLLAGADYLWSILGNPIEKPNIIYHLPNLILYSFGIVGLKNLVEKLEHKSWLDKVLDAQAKLAKMVADGSVPFSLKKGHSVLFVGTGDFIAMQFVLNHEAAEVITLAHTLPSYTNIWSRYHVGSIYDDLKQAITLADGGKAGEYLFFPVKDSSIFLPGPQDYDLSPQMLDILCQNIRSIESEHDWKTKPILIVGDKFHSSTVQSEDDTKVMVDSLDTISLDSVAKKHKKVSVFDPTDIVLNKVLKIARGRKIVFRATKEGISEYKKRFYDRLKLLGYAPSRPGILTIGYDIFEDQTEQQTLSRKIDNYYPVVLSKNVRDALIRNGYKADQFLYVPDLVLETIAEAAARQ